MTTYSSDPIATSPGLRTLGTGAQQAAAGNDPRMAGKPVQTVTYQTFTSPTNVFYTALATDGVTILVDRTTASVRLIASNYHLYGYEMPITSGLTDWIAVWDEGDVNSPTIAWESVGASSGATPPPPPPPSGLAFASFAVTQTTSSLVHLDASASVADTYAWTVDGVARPETTAIVDYGPMTVGTHTFRLDVTKTSDSSGDSNTQTKPVVWLGVPLGGAQHDSANGLVGSWGMPDGTNSALGLPKWANLPLIGPWRNNGTLNMVEGYPGAGDGTARLTIYDDNHISLMTRVGDRPGNAGGYRSAMEMNTAYDGRLAGYPLGSGNPNICGNLATGATTGSVRFYRLEVMLPGENPGGPRAVDRGDGGGPGAGFLNQNNVFEIHGNAGGDSPVRLETDGSGTHLRMAFESRVGGASPPANFFDVTPLVYDTWYNYVVELLLSLDPSVGYIRVYRDGVVTTSVPPGTDGTGKYFSITQQTDVNSVVIPLAFDIQNYRTRAALINLPNYPDAIVHYRNIRIGPTLASVYP